MLKNRILSLLLALILCAGIVSLLGAAGTAEETPLALSLTDAEDMHGESVRLTLKVADNTHLNGFQFRLVYDASMLAYEDSTFLRLNNYSVVNEGDGYVEFMATDTTTYTRSGNLMYVWFTLLQAGESTVRIDADPARGDGFYYVNDESELVDLPFTAAPATVRAAIDPAVDFHIALEAQDTPANETAAVLLTMKNAPTAYGFSVQVNYDADKLAFDHEAFSATFPYGRAVQGDGWVRLFACTEIFSPVDGDALMATLFFNVTDPDKAPGSTYDLSLSFYNSQPSYTLDENRKTVNLTAVGTVDTVLTLTAPTANPYDLNGDDAVTIEDVTSLLNVLADSSFAQNLHADPDVNGSGSATIEDVTVLLNVIAGRN